MYRAEDGFRLADSTAAMYSVNLRPECEPVVTDLIG